MNAAPTILAGVERERARAELAVLQAHIAILRTLGEVGETSRELMERTWEARSHAGVRDVGDRRARAIGAGAGLPAAAQLRP